MAGVIDANGCYIDPKYKEDRFFLSSNRRSVMWVYHNADAVSGDQFVEQLFDQHMFNTAVNKAASEAIIQTLAEGVDTIPMHDRIFSALIDVIADADTIYLYDVGDFSYDAARADFDAVPDYIGANEQTVFGIAQHMNRSRDTRER